MRIANQGAIAGFMAWAIYTAAFCIPLYAQQTPSPSPAPSPSQASATAAATNPDAKEVKKVAEQPKPPEPRFKLYGWIEGGLMGIPILRLTTTTSGSCSLTVPTNPC